MFTSMLIDLPRNRYRSCFIELYVGQCFCYFSIINISHGMAKKLRKKSDEKGYKLIITITKISNWLTISWLVFFLTQLYAKLYFSFRCTYDCFLYFLTFWYFCWNYPRQSTLYRDDYLTIRIFLNVFCIL